MNAIADTQGYFVNVRSTFHGVLDPPNGLHQATLSLSDMFKVVKSFHTPKKIQIHSQVQSQVSYVKVN
jgi:hypothetical protein